MVCGFLMIAAVIALEPIGELPETAFLGVLSDCGYTTWLNEPPGGPKASNADGSFRLRLGTSVSEDSGITFVKEARAFLALDVARAVPVRQVDSWLAKNKFADVTVTTYISGRVLFEMLLATPSDTPDQMKSRAQRLQRTGLRFGKDFAAINPKQSDDLWRPGPAHYSPGAVMDPIQVEDVDFIASHFEWDKQVDPVALGKRGSLVRIEGVTFVVSPHERGMLVLLAQFVPEPNKVSRYLQRPPQITWADVQVERSLATIVQRHRLTGEVTAGQLTAILLEFARSVKALDLL